MCNKTCDLLSRNPDTLSPLPPSESATATSEALGEEDEYEPVAKTTNTEENEGTGELVSLQVFYKLHQQKYIYYA